MTLNNTDLTGDAIEIISDSPSYPDCALSNFSNFAFVLDGVACGGMEGFLQSLKFLSNKKRREIAALYGKAAKKAGEGKRLWKILGVVFWNGKIYSRFGKAYSRLVERAYDAAFSSNEEFRRALSASEKRPLSHKIGKTKKRETILTENEFIFNLYRLRGKLT